jgi:hypothetical protein
MEMLEALTHMVDPPWTKESQFLGGGFEERGAKARHKLPC